MGCGVSSVREKEEEEMYEKIGNQVKSNHSYNIGKRLHDVFIELKYIQEKVRMTKDEAGRVNNVINKLRTIMY